MGIKFLQNIDAERNKFEEAGFEVVDALPTTNLFVGRQVMYNGRLYVYNGSLWVNVNAPYEANLQWGGRNIADNFSPIDAAMMSELSGNLMAFPNPAGISIEYSRDGGVTWLDYGATEEVKIKIFTTTTSLVCGKADTDGLPATVGYQLRITITPNDCNLYTALNKIIMTIATNGANNCWFTFKGLKNKDVVAGNEDDTYYDTIINKAVVKGWTGYNVVNFDEIKTSNDLTYSHHANLYYRLRLIFGYDTVISTSHQGLKVRELRFFGNGRYALPSNLARYNHLYSYDWKQNALFPAKVESKELINFDINNIEPTQTGSSVSKTSTWLWQYLTQAVNWLKANNVRLSSYNTKVAALEQADSDNNANTLSAKESLLSLIEELSNSLAAVATSGSYNDLTNKPTQFPNPNPIIIKTADDGVLVRYDGSASGGVILEAGDNAELTATQDSDDTMTVKFGAIVPQTLPNPNALNIMVLDSEGALLGPSMVYDGVAAKYFELIEGYGIELTNSNLSNGQAIAINLKQIAGTTLLGNANGTTATPQAITMAQLREMLGSLMLNDISITLGGNSSYTLPCYIDYADTRYPCRISSDATGLQIYRNGVWATIGKFCQCRTIGTITNSNIDSWYEDTVPNYELDESLSAALFAEDLTGKFGTSIAGTWTGKTVMLNLASVSIKDTKSAWEMLKKNMSDCFPSDSVEKIRYYYNVAIPSGEVVTKVELSYHNGLGMCTVHFYTEG